MDDKGLIGFVVSEILEWKDAGGGAWIDHKGRVRGFSLESWEDAGEVVEAAADCFKVVLMDIKVTSGWVVYAGCHVGEMSMCGPEPTATRAIIKAVATIFGYQEVAR